MTTKRIFLEKIGAVLFALLLWQLAAMSLGSALLLPAPLAVAERLSQLIFTLDFWKPIGFTCLRIALGFALSLLVGVLLATLSSRFRLSEVLLWPFIAVIKATPVASFVILCLIWLTSANLSIFISFLMVLPIVYTNVLVGIQSTDKKLLEMAHFFAVRPLKKIRYLYLPHLRPHLGSACSVGLGLAWKAGVAAEVIGIPTGSIGEKLYEAKIYLSSPDLFAWTFVIIFVSILFERLFAQLLKRLK